MHRLRVPPLDARVVLAFHHPQGARRGCLHACRPRARVQQSQLSKPLAGGDEHGQQHAERAGGEALHLRLHAQPSLARGLAHPLARRLRVQPHVHLRRAGLHDVPVVAGGALLHHKLPRLHAHEGHGVDDSFNGGFVQKVKQLRAPHSAARQGPHVLRLVYPGYPHRVAVSTRARVDEGELLVHGRLAAAALPGVVRGYAAPAGDALLLGHLHAGVLQLAQRVRQVHRASHPLPRTQRAHLVHLVLLERQLLAVGCRDVRGGNGRVPRNHPVVVASGSRLPPPSNVHVAGVHRRAHRLA
mmetsp:Transcript_33296/g.63934  ORF Transcript_33296/g.63934 Transcript_33296/m.63934 type:complete len:299 (+) Transcript_33296:2295-3191(+)